MKKNLLYQHSADSIIERIKKLQPGNKAVWGKMNATEMLLHANLCNEEIFTSVSSRRSTSFKQYLLRIIALYLAPHFKKGIKGDSLKETTGKIETLKFEEQKEKFIALIKKFPEYKQPIRLFHIAFGNLSTREWGIAAYKHMDHHLRQFGV
ncbi:MAG: DUF1569 domain-containing protein [Bacteroidetes bacterium]|nr:DUF1569 domain-containing protein [Bacteroidota bacterium]